MRLYTVEKDGKRFVAAGYAESEGLWPVKECFGIEADCMLDIVCCGEKQAQRIERESRKKLSDPYRDRPALKQAEILDCLRDPERRRRLIGEDELSPFTWPEGENTPDWLMKWLDRADCEEETEEPLNEAV